MNSDILSAVLVKWAEPFIAQIASSKLAEVPFVANIESKVRSTGWVSGNWSLMTELTPYTGVVASTLAQPVIKQMFSNVPDETIPAMVHGIVDKAIENGGLSILEDHVSFSKEDCVALKRLLNANLPYSQVEPIKLKEDEQC